ncbi:hypothetical protein Tco_1505105 [Tanacetum coccineum]
MFYHNLNPKRLKNPGKPKRTTKISQSSGPIHLVADETVYKEWEDRMESAAITASSLEAEQDSGNNNRTQSMATLNEPKSNDLPLSRVNTLGSGEDNMKLMELMELCTKLSENTNRKSDLSELVRKRNERYSEIKNRKRAGDELEQEKAKKQKGDDDQEEAAMKRHIEIVKDDEVAIDAIPLATKPPVIVECQIDKDGRMGYFKLIRADGSLKRYYSMIKMLQGIDREDLETLWKLVKAKHENTRLEDDYERVLREDFKVMFELDIKSDVCRNLQGYKVTVWKLFDNYGVHFIRFRYLHIFMLVEKRYPLTPITISNMLNKKLQADRWNEMCYQLLKLMTKQEKGQ